MVTGSHNPPDYNGFKMVLAGQAIYGEQIQALRTRIEQGDFTEGAGDYVQVDIRQQYIDRIVSDVKLSRPMKIAVDCGNGVAGAFAPELFRAMGSEVTELFCEVDAISRTTIRTRPPRREPAGPRAHAADHGLRTWPRLRWRW